MTLKGYALRYFGKADNYLTADRTRHLRMLEHAELHTANTLILVALILFYKLQTYLRK